VCCAVGRWWSVGRTWSVVLLTVGFVCCAVRGCARGLRLWNESILALLIIVSVNLPDLLMYYIHSTSVFLTFPLGVACREIKFV